MTKEAPPSLGLSWQTAAATPELVAPTQDPESEAPPRGAPSALGLGARRARRGRLSISRKTRLVQVKDEFSRWAKEQSGQTDGVEPLYLGWKRWSFSALLNCFLKACLSLPRRKQTQRQASSSEGSSC